MFMAPMALWAEYLIPKNNTVIQSCRLKFENVESNSVIGAYQVTYNNWSISIGTVTSTNLLSCVIIQRSKYALVCVQVEENKMASTGVSSSELPI